MTNCNLIKKHLTPGLRPGCKAMSAMSTVVPDPTFAAIERFLHAKAENENDRTDDPTIMNAFFAAQNAVLQTEPTTHAGAAALIGLALTEVDPTKGAWCAENQAIAVLETLQKVIPSLEA